MLHVSQEAFAAFIGLDRADAELQVEILLTHRDKLTPLTPPNPTMRAKRPCGP